MLALGNVRAANAGRRRCPASKEARALVSRGEIKVGEALAGEYGDLGRLIQRAYAEYARPGDPLWGGYLSMLADVAGRAAFAGVLVAVAGGHVVGTATVELDQTIEGTRDLRPGQANFRLLAMDPPARG
jgi:hypothetical protein